VTLGNLDSFNLAQGLEDLSFHLLEVVNWLWWSKSLASSDKEIVEDSRSAVSTRISDKNPFTKAFSLPRRMKASQIIILFFNIVPLLKSLNLRNLIRLIKIVDIFVEMFAASKI
jgi:hypothetical protein